MKTIAFFNVKGGVGKTSSSITVAHLLATVFGKRTLLVDLDPQSNATDFYDCYEQQFTVENLLTGRGFSEAGKEVNVTSKDVVVKTKYANLDIIPANLSLGRVEKELVADVRIPQQFRLKEQIRTISEDYDIMILDCSPSAESLVNTNGLAMADVVLVPMKCDKWATRGLEATLEVINTIKTYNYNLSFGGCFFVQWENRNINKTVFDTLKNSLGNKMLSQKIRKNKSVEEMTYAGEPLAVYDKNGTSTQDYIELTKYILEYLI